MKRAVILHATDSKPSDYWLPWLKQDLENSGYEVFVPKLPENHMPNRKKYDEFLRNSGWDFTDNLLIGHSSGATTILNLLSSDWFPKVQASVLVATFLNEKWTKDADWSEDGQFDNLFLENYDPAKLKQKCESFYFVHGSDDPFCDIEDAKILCDQVGGKFLTIPNGHHLGGTSGLTELPKLEETLKKDGLLS